MIDFASLKRNLKKPTDGFKTVRLAILGDSATQFLTQAIKGYGIERSLHLDIADTKLKAVTAYVMQKNGEYDNGEAYQMGEKVPVHIFDGHLIDMNDIFD